MPHSAIFGLLAVGMFGALFVWLWFDTPRTRRLMDPTRVPGEWCPSCGGSGDAPAGSAWTDCGTCGGMGLLPEMEDAR